MRGEGGGGAITVKKFDSSNDDCDVFVGGV